MSWGELGEEIQKADMSQGSRIKVMKLQGMADPWKDWSGLVGDVHRVGSGRWIIALDLWTAAAMATADDYGGCSCIMRDMTTVHGVSKQCGAGIAYSSCLHRPCV